MKRKDLLLLVLPVEGTHHCTAAYYTLEMSNRPFSHQCCVSSCYHEFTLLVMKASDESQAIQAEI